MGEATSAECVALRFGDGEILRADGLRLQAWYTPGHTDDSYSLVMRDRVFTGDTLLIRGTGRTDFQNGDPGAQYDSLFGRLLKLADETLVYPGRAGGQQRETSIARERGSNAELQPGMSRRRFIARKRLQATPAESWPQHTLAANRRCQPFD